MSRGRLLATSESLNAEEHPGWWALAEDIENYLLVHFPIDNEGLPQRAETPLFTAEGELAPYLVWRVSEGLSDNQNGHWVVALTTPEPDEMAAPGVVLSDPVEVAAAYVPWATVAVSGQFNFRRVHRLQLAANSYVDVVQEELVLEEGTPYVAFTASVVVGVASNTQLQVYEALAGGGGEPVTVGPVFPEDPQLGALHVFNQNYPAAPNEDIAHVAIFGSPADSASSSTSPGSSSDIDRTKAATFNAEYLDPNTPFDVDSLLPQFKYEGGFPGTLVWRGLTAEQSDAFMMLRYDSLVALNDEINGALYDPEVSPNVREIDRVFFNMIFGSVWDPIAGTIAANGGSWYNTGTGTNAWRYGRYTITLNISRESSTSSDPSSDTSSDLSSDTSPLSVLPFPVAYAENGTTPLSDQVPIVRGDLFKYTDRLDSQGLGEEGRFLTPTQEIRWVRQTRGRAQLIGDIFVGEVPEISRLDGINVVERTTINPNPLWNGLIKLVLLQSGVGIPVEIDVSPLYRRPNWTDENPSSPDHILNRPSIKVDGTDVDDLGDEVHRFLSFIHLGDNDMAPYPQEKRNIFNVSFGYPFKLVEDLDTLQVPPRILEIADMQLVIDDESLAPVDVDVEIYKQGHGMMNIQIVPVPALSKIGGREVFVLRDDALEMVYNALADKVTALEAQITALEGRVP